MQDDDELCEVCGLWLDDCICPECPVCGQFGNPMCYDDHGLILTSEQVASKHAVNTRKVEALKKEARDLMQEIEEYKQLLADYDEWIKDKGDAANH